MNNSFKEKLFQSKVLFSNTSIKVGNKLPSV